MEVNPSVQNVLINQIPETMAGPSSSVHEGLISDSSEAILVPDMVLVADKEETGQGNKLIDPDTANLSGETHVNSPRGSPKPLENIGVIGAKNRGKWVDQTEEQFEFAPSLLGLKFIQLKAVANKDTVLSEEGHVIWKENFAQRPLEGALHSLLKS